MNSAPKIGLRETLVIVLVRYFGPPSAYLGKPRLFFETKYKHSLILVARLGGRSPLPREVCFKHRNGPGRLDPRLLERSFVLQTHNSHAHTPSSAWIKLGSQHPPHLISKPSATSNCKFGQNLSHHVMPKVLVLKAQGRHVMCAARANDNSLQNAHFTLKIWVHGAAGLIMHFYCLQLLANPSKRGPTDFATRVGNPRASYRAENPTRPKIGQKYQPDIQIAPAAGHQKIPRKYRKNTPRIRILYFFVFQGRFEGVFRGVSCFVFWGYFCTSLAFPFCSWSRSCQNLCKVTANACLQARTAWHQCCRHASVLSTHSDTQALGFLSHHLKCEMPEMGPKRGNSLTNKVAERTRNKRFPHSTVYECLKACFRNARFLTHRHAAYQCLKKPPTFFRHASVF